MGQVRKINLSFQITEISTTAITKTGYNRNIVISIDSFKVFITPSFFSRFINQFISVSIYLVNCMKGWVSIIYIKIEMAFVDPNLFGFPGIII